MSIKEPESWITVHGKHIPIGAGESKEEAIKQALDKNTKKKDESDKNKSLIPKNSYTNIEEYKQAREWLRKHSSELSNIQDKVSNAYKELEEAQNKHLDPEMVKILGRNQARMFVKDKDYPDTASARQKLDRLKADQKELEQERNKYQAIMRRYDTKYSEQQRQEYGKPEFKQASGDYKGFKNNETTTPYVDTAIKEGKAKIVEMTPEQYIHECSHYIFNNSTVEKTLRSRVGNSDTEKYAHMMKYGTKFDTPYIDYTREAQEGLHRAVAAYMNGYKKIPVVIIGKRRL